MIERLLLARWLACARYPLLGHHHRYPRRARALRARQPCIVPTYRASLHILTTYSARSRILRLAR